MNPWNARDGTQKQGLDGNVGQQQYYTREQAAAEFEQIQIQHRQELQQQQLELMKQQIHRQHQENQELQQQRQQQQSTTSSLKTAMLSWLKDRGLSPTI